MNNKIRIAPTPSGFLHLGNVLSFALTAAVANRTQSQILLRIDDLDHQRVNEAFIHDIFDTLNYLDIPWHEGPRNLNEVQKHWSQCHRMELYQHALTQLENSGQVFACTCSRSEIQSISEYYPGNCYDLNKALNAELVKWRLNTNMAGTIPVNNLLKDCTHALLPASVNHFIVRKRDGFPAYQLSSLVDDVHFGITHIVRGADLWPSTVAQQHLANVLNAHSFTRIKFYHHELLMDDKNQKLSKSAGATSVRYLRQQGYNAAQIFQQIAVQAGITKTVNNWQQLADVVWERDNTFN
jgi:glutamyl/glutaminyl-tRNA synthetase